MKRLMSWAAVLPLLGIPVTSYAEDVTITTYYPSPRGVYEQLRTTDETHLATNAGQVGIGTSAPAQKLEVGDPGDATTRVKITAYGVAGLDFSDAAGAASQGVIEYRHADGSMRFTTETLPGAEMMVLRAGLVGLGTTSPDRRLTIVGTGANSEWISFKDAGGATQWHMNYLSTGLNVAETGVADGRLFLDDGGNVGIGTTAPAFRLDIPASPSVARIGGAEIGHWPPNPAAYAYFGNQSLDHGIVGNYAILQQTTGQTFVNAAAGQLLRLRVNNADNMVLNGAGDVAIGTTTFRDDIGWAGSLNVNGQVSAARYYDNAAGWYVDSDVTSRMNAIDANEVRLFRGAGPLPSPVCLQNGSGCPAQSCSCSCP